VTQVISKPVINLPRSSKNPRRVADVRLYDATGAANVKIGSKKQSRPELFQRIKRIKQCLLPHPPHG
jgi:hypothetical protein